MILERGITALCLGIDILKLKQNDEILLPDKICDDIIGMLKFKNIKPIYYSLNSDLSPKWASVNKIMEHPNNIKAILMIHYFGQPQDISNFIDFKIKHNIFLIEDNAHGHGGYYNNILLGKYGDIGISSPRKMLDLNTVGILFLNNTTFNFPLDLPKGVKISYFSAYARKLQFYFPKLRSLLLYIKNISKTSKQVLNTDYSIKSADKYSEKKYLNSNWDKIAYNRRSNWILWTNYMNDFGLRPIFNLCNTSSPWAIPFYIESEIEFNKWISWANKKGNIFFLWPNITFSTNSRQIMCIRLDIKPHF